MAFTLFDTERVPSSSTFFFKGATFHFSKRHPTYRGHEIHDRVAIGFPSEHMCSSHDELSSRLALLRHNYFQKNFEQNWLT